MHPLAPATSVTRPCHVSVGLHTCRRSVTGRMQPCLSWHLCTFARHQPRCLAAVAAAAVGPSGSDGSSHASNALPGGSDVIPAAPAAPMVSSISLSQAQTMLPQAYALSKVSKSPTHKKPLTGEPSTFTFYLSAALVIQVLQLHDKQTLHYAVVREDEPNKLMPVVETVVRPTTGNRMVVCPTDMVPNHLTAGRWVVAGMRLTRVLWCSQRQLYVFVYSPAKDAPAPPASMDITYQQACVQLEQVHELAEGLVVPKKLTGGAKKSTVYKFMLPIPIFREVLGLQANDPITWTAVKQDQLHAEQLMQAQATATGNTQYLTAAGSGHVAVVGRWVHEEGLRLKQAERGTGGGVCVRLRGHCVM